MKKIELVSAIMAAKNSEKYITQAIESILNQSYDRFELIIIDHCSTDNTLKIINSYKSKKIKILRLDKSAKRWKLSEVRNYGIKNSSGNYIAICDSDDVRYPSSFEIELKYLISHKNIELLGSQYDEIDPDGNIIENPSAKTLFLYTGHKINNLQYRNERDWRRNLSNAPSRVLKNIYLYRKGPYSCPLAPTTTMFSRRAFNFVNGYDVEGHYFLDAELHRKFARNFDIALLDNILSGWRQHDKRMSIEQWIKGGE